MPAPPVATIKSLMRISSSVFAIDGRSMTWMRSAGAPTCRHPLRMTSTTAADVFLVLGWGAMMIALRAFSAPSALTGGVASGPVVGMRAAMTPTGLAILTKPRAGSSSTMPQVLIEAMSARVPITRLANLAILS